MAALRQNDPSHPSLRNAQELGAMAVVTDGDITALTYDLERVQMIHSEQSSDA